MNTILPTKTRDRVDLTAIRAEIATWFESFHDSGHGYGHYISPKPYRRDNRPQAGHFYSSADIALLRGIMGEDFSTSLTAAQRGQWLDYLNSFQNPADGSYQTLHYHSNLHAHGTAVGAIGLLGGKMAHPVRLYEPFDTPEKVVPWLETTIDWSSQWSESHKFWGGIHCFSLSSRVTAEWLDAVFAWLDSNLDPRTGWWQRGTIYTDVHQPLGGSAHILPLYQHHHRPFPHAERLVDSVLTLQRGAGNWHTTASGLSYLDLDGLYVLDFCKSYIGSYRAADIAAGAARFSRWFLERFEQLWNQILPEHPHHALCLIGTLGLLQRFDPEHYSDDRSWTDIFSDRRLYRAAEVEVEAHATAH